MSRIWLVLAIGSILLSQSEAPHIQRAVEACQAGQEALHKKELQQATEQFKKAIEIEPTYQEAFEGLIDAYVSAGQRVEAAAVMTQLLEIEPTLSSYRLELGKILLEQGQPERALAQYSFVLKLDPLNADALFGFATVAQKLGMQERAADALRRGHEKYPGDSRFK